MFRRWSSDSRLTVTDRPIFCRFGVVFRLRGENASKFTDMITKKNNLYKIRLEELALKDGTLANKSIDFEFENHDDVFDIITKMQDKNIFGDKQQDIEFALGIKLFSEVMLRHKDHPLFEELKPAFGQFMKKLKEQGS
jgi:hypothetical protein